MLDIRSAYMLRDDGVVLDSGARHPYILCHHDDKIEENLKALFLYNKNWIPWILENTRYVSTKQKLKELLFRFVDAEYNYGDKLFGISFTDILHLVKDHGIVPIIHPDKEIDRRREELKNMFEEVNFLVNQEFLRFRMSSPIAYIGNYNDIYFRVSSFDFDWFPYIWNVIYENRNIIDTVTVMYDKQSGKVAGSSDKYYVLGGRLIKKLPTGQ